jgi:hypothetical protein
MRARIVQADAAIARSSAHVMTRRYRTASRRKRAERGVLERQALEAAAKLRPPADRRFFGDRAAIYALDRVLYRVNSLAHRTRLPVARSCLGE